MALSYCEIVERAPNWVSQNLDLSSTCIALYVCDQGQVTLNFLIFFILSVCAVTMTTHLPCMPHTLMYGSHGSLNHPTSLMEVLHIILLRYMKIFGAFFEIKTHNMRVKTGFLPTEGYRGNGRDGSGASLWVSPCSALLLDGCALWQIFKQEYPLKTPCLCPYSSLKRGCHALWNRKAYLNPFFYLIGKSLFTSSFLNLETQIWLNLCSDWCKLLIKSAPQNGFKYTKRYF